MMGSPRLEEKNIIKDVRNLFWLKKETDGTAIKDIRNLFRLKKENPVIKNRILSDIRNLFQHEGKDYCKPARVGNFCSNNYIEYEGKDNRNKTLSVEEYLNKVRLYLKDIINNIKKSETWKSN